MSDQESDQEPGGYLLPGYMASLWEDFNMYTKEFGDPGEDHWHDAEVMARFRQAFGYDIRFPVFAPEPTAADRLRAWLRDLWDVATGNYDHVS